MVEKKTDLDLDFDDIGGKEDSTPPRKEVPRKQEPSGIVLSIPRDGGWLSKSLETCTAEEFLDWSYSVGVHESYDMDKLKDYNYKFKCFNRIVMFHRKLSFVIPGARALLGVK